MKCFVCFICPTESGVWRAQDLLSSILALQNYCEFWGASEALRDPVHLENGVDSAGICPGLSIPIQIVHPSLFLEVEKLLQHNAFLRVRSVRSRKNGHAFKKSKNVTCTWPIPFVCQTRRGNREKGKSISGAEDIKNRPFQLEMSVWTIWSKVFQCMFLFRKCSKVRIL